VNDLVWFPLVVLLLSATLMRVLRFARLLRATRVWGTGVYKDEVQQTCPVPARPSILVLGLNVYDPGSSYETITHKQPFHYECSVTCIHISPTAFMFEKRSVVGSTSSLEALPTSPWQSLVTRLE
jgi:hypothetical protein